MCACVCKRSRVRETDEDGARERENKKAHWLIRTLSRQLSLLEEEIYTVSTSVPSQTNSISELTETAMGSLCPQRATVHGLSFTEQP